MRITRAPEHIRADVEALPGIAARLYRNNDIGLEMI